MALLDKKSYQLPVTDIVEDGKKLYYVVVHDGVEYKIRLYDFQKSLPRPESILCLARAVQDNGIILVQDYAQFLGKFYETGAVYPFKVVSVHTSQPNGYYNICDKNDFRFRLIHNGSPALIPHQNINCRVESIKGGRMRLRLVADDSRPHLKFISLSSLADASGHYKAARMLAWVFRRGSSSGSYFANAANAYAENNGEWIMLTLATVHELLDNGTDLRMNGVEILDAVIDVCLYLLEGSDFLSEFDDENRTKLQHSLECYVAKDEILRKALILMKDGRDETYVTDIITKMRQSGYLYNPGEKLALMMAIFTLRPESLDSNMSHIVEIITGGKQRNWMLEPFRSAFLMQLDYYVRLTKDRADRTSNDDSAGRELLHKMQIVLALQLLMSIPGEKSDLDVNRAALYRYLTFDNIHLAPDLLDKAYIAATGNSPLQLDFGWRDIKDPLQLSHRMLESFGNSMPDFKPQVFEGNGAVLHMMASSITIMPASRSAHMRAALPVGLLPWHNIQIWSNSKILQPSLSETSLRRLSDFWTAIENDLFDWHETSSTVGRRRHLPHTGEEVEIIVDAISDNGQILFCSVVDEFHSGEGYLPIRNVVQFNIDKLSLDYFNDDNGNPFKFKAVVEYIDSDGVPVFSMLSGIRNFIDSQMEAGDIVTCIFLDKTTNFICKERNYPHEAFIGLTEFGESVACPVDRIFDSGEINLYSSAEVEFIELSHSGQMVCRFLRMEAENHPFTKNEAFANLMFSYNGFCFPNGEDRVALLEDEDEDLHLDSIDINSVRELIRIIDRVATLEKDSVKMYNYLEFCRILGRLIGDSTVADYYSRRLGFLERLQVFIDSGYINVDAIDTEEEGFADYPLIQMRTRQLKVLSCLDHPEKNDRLWEVVKNEQVADTVKLAKLALMSNMAMEFRLSDDVRERVNREVSDLLKIKVKLPELVSYGDESQEVEFKSSYICPGYSLKVDMEAQRDHILQRLCGFLNSASGGTLYIGVNNFGFASGLESDLRHPLFGGSRDKFDLKVRNDIRLFLGGAANECVSSHWEKAGAKDIYVLRIRPLRPASTDLKGIYWLRQGTSTYPLSKNELNDVVRTRTNPTPPSDKTHSLLSSSHAAPAIPVAGDDALPKAHEADAAASSPMHAASSPAVTSTRHTNRTESTPADESYLIPEMTDKVSYGRLRRNITHDWEEDYVVPEFFIHLNDDGTYCLSKEVSYATDNSLAIQQSEMDSLAVFVYRDGRVITVPLEELNEKQFDKNYKRYQSEHPIAFASVGLQADKLLLVYQYGNNRYGRFESLSSLRKGNLLDEPLPVTSADFDRLVYCDIVTEQESLKARTLHKVSFSSLGKDISENPVKGLLESMGLSF